MKMSTIYLLHILVCSDTEQSILIPACHSLSRWRLPFAFALSDAKKKRSQRADHSDISLRQRATHAHTYVLIIPAAWAAKTPKAKMSSHLLLLYSC